MVTGVIISAMAKAVITMVTAVISGVTISVFSVSQPAPAVAACCPEQASETVPAAVQCSAAGEGGEG